MKRLLFFEVGWVAFFMLAIALISTSVAALYLIESNSMEPSIVPGDRILVNRLAYGLRLPFAGSPVVSWAKPKRGDVIFFRFDSLNDVFVKRVIGLPGDDVSLRRGVVYVNSIPIQQQDIRRTLTSLANDRGMTERLEMQSRLNFQPHHIFMSKEPDRTFFETDRYAVPPHQYFVLGDNRDDSVDSRQYGFVGENQILGKAMGVIFSTTGQGILWPNFRPERFLTWEKK